jgi:hypothetical protein
LVIWYILWSFGIYCGHLVYIVVIWYYIVVIWYISPVLVFAPRKNLATLL